MVALVMRKLVPLAVLSECILDVAALLHVVVQLVVVRTCIMTVLIDAVC
jgi:hypothetical protein